jgi:hypothetical protein
LENEELIFSQISFFLVEIWRQKTSSFFANFLVNQDGLGQLQFRLSFLSRLLKVFRAGTAAVAYLL